MREILELASDTYGIDHSAVIQRLGSPEGSEAGSRIGEALEQAEESLIATATPRCVVEPVDRDTFAEIFDGAGHNDRDTPVHGVLEHKVALAVFALTLGQAVTDRITMLFAEHDYLTATLLDAMASSVAERLVENLEKRFALQAANRDNSSILPAVLAYSPGYCGWHVSGQAALFAFLKPEQIGISLGPGCMMNPLKSVSGVLVSGQPEAHFFDMIFSCCSICDTLECRTRIERIADPSRATMEFEWIRSNK